MIFCSLTEKRQIITSYGVKPTFDKELIDRVLLMTFHYTQALSVFHYVGFCHKEHNKTSCCTVQTLVLLAAVCGLFVMKIEGIGALLSLTCESVSHIVHRGCLCIQPLQLLHK